MKITQLNCIGTAKINQLSCESIKICIRMPPFLILYSLSFTHYSNMPLQISSLGILNALDW